MNDNIINNYFDSRFKFDLGRKKVWDAIVDHLQPRYFNNIETVVELGGAKVISYLAGKFLDPGNADKVQGALESSLSF